MSNKVLMKGNEVLAEAGIRAGCRLFFGYPITPQTEISAYMAKQMPKVGGLFLQAESEIAAVNMVLGAAATGARVMTSSSSPGISLKTEGLSYLAASDLPCVILNVQRGGPGLGGIQPAQSDYFQAVKAPGHGDLKYIVYSPSTVQEMADAVPKAFEMAEKYRVPAMILIDGLLGQMMEAVEFSDKEFKQIEKPWATVGTKEERKPNIINSLHLEADILESIVLERFERYKKIEKALPEAECYLTDDAELIIIAYGASARISRSAINQAREKGIKVGLINLLTVWPYPSKIILENIKSAKDLLVVEMSMGQMIEDVRLTVEGKLPVHFFGRTGGVIPTPKEVLEQIEKIYGGEK